MPRTPSPPTSRSLSIQRLRLLKPKDHSPEDFTAILPTDPADRMKFMCIAAALSLALDLLSSVPSKSALRLYTYELAKEYPQQAQLRGMDHARATRFVESFLQTIRANPPEILVTARNSMRNKNGRTTKSDCQGNFDAKAAAVIELNDVVS